MAQTPLIQVRVDEDLKREADELFTDLGLDTSTAIRIFLKQAIKRRGLPFDVNQNVNTNNISIGETEAWDDYNQYENSRQDPVYLLINKLVRLVKNKKSDEQEMGS